MRLLQDRVTESAFQKYICRYAEEHRWRWLHIESRAGRNQKNGAKGPLGKGWPDLILVRDHRMVAAELKTQEAPRVKTEQTAILEIIGDVPGVEVYVWRPSDLAQMMQVLA